MVPSSGEIIDTAEGPSLSQLNIFDSDEEIHVLHVDDEPDFAAMAAEFLQRQDDRLTVSTATDAGEALTLLRSEAFDCVVSDFDMPGQNGIEFLETLREDHPYLPFILFTGKGSEEVAARAISAGVSDYLQKESGTEQYAVLANRIINLVDKRQAELEYERIHTHQLAITANISDAVLTIDTNSTIIFANQAIEDILGYPPRGIEGESLTQLIPTRYRKDHTKGVKRYLSTGEQGIDWRNVEFPALHSDGHEVPVSITFGEFQIAGEHRFVGVIRDVSDRKRREEQLRHYKRAAEGASDLLAACNTEYGLLFANKRYREYHGLADEEVSQKALPGVLGDRWQDEVKSRVDAALEGEEVRYEMERENPEGETRTLDIQYYPLRSEDETIVGAVAAMRDVTEQREQQRELKRIKDRFKALTEYAPDLITVIDEAGVIQYESPSIERLLGYGQEELVGQNAFEYIHPEDKDQVWDTWEGVIETPGTVTESAEFRFRHADGSWVWLESIASNRTDSSIEGYVINSREVTDRKEREQELVRTKRQLEAILDATPAAVFLKDIEGRILLENKQSRELLGIEDEDIIGRQMEELLPKELAEQFIENQQRALEAGQTIEIEEEIPVGDRRHTFLTYYSPVFDESGEPIGVCGISSDITEQKERERELKAQNQRLDKFVSVVSHDLRNPLSVAAGNIQLLKEDYDDDRFDAVARAHDRMAELIEDLLTLARGGDEVGEMEPVDLESIADSGWRNVETDEASLNVEPGGTLMADRSRLRQLLENLFRNAVEHAGAGVMITVGLLESGNGFFVEDDGPGIAPDEREKVFGPGYTEADNGTGFGLSIVQQIAEGHGWEITLVESADGGARFEFHDVQMD